MDQPLGTVETNPMGDGLVTFRTEQRKFRAQRGIFRGSGFDDPN